MKNQDIRNAVKEAGLYTNECKCSRNPIQSESNPIRIQSNPNPKPIVPAALEESFHDYSEMRKKIAHKKQLTD